jgi:hypothetical protein
MSTPKKRKTSRQKPGVQLALKLGLPTVCPLLHIDEEKGEEVCQISGQRFMRPISLCQLDVETGCDYRLCLTFTQWFWAEVQKQEAAKVNQHE